MVGPIMSEPSPSDYERPLRRAQSLLRSAKNVAVLTGAGISAESGIPTFRGAIGLWKTFRPEDLATPTAFGRNPKLVWQWYDWRRRLVQQATPNLGHGALVKLERCVPELTVITQNVDGLHRDAGSASVLELHGNIWRVQCTVCEREWEDRRVPIPLPPSCECGGIVRPGVVWFGEALAPKVWRSAETAVLRSSIILVVGTSALVYPAAGLVHLARQVGAHVIEINTERTAISGSVEIAIPGRAAEVLPALVEDLSIHK
jgi:NAD-dependent deacetylase